MKTQSSWFKAVALASSVLLVSVFIGYRAGAFDWFLGRVGDVYDDFLPGSKAPFNTVSGKLGGDSAAQTKKPAEPDPSIIMSSSKSIAPLIPPSASPKAEQTPKQD